LSGWRFGKKVLVTMILEADVVVKETTPPQNSLALPDKQL